ncbi:uncharacterized protein LOC111710816 [Eurytemora carolleeae]|uniref:uncharacterized protein LOC111710816 n=1 Tax=Eurytemora carolleeae TaxID=1294199 RepID=UPI000C764FF8|nr:uncharacterized protein LOC111710816 [Eurytemora carolleeae]|eukprot:XP_023340730.1 uncharacterized protein LOC111710816 [Eurytemora affinis]
MEPKTQLVIGRELGQAGKTRNQYLGNVANVNIYSGKLGSDQLKMMTTHPCNYSGDFLAWQNMTFVTSGIVPTIEDPTLCKPLTRMKIPVLENVPFSVGIDTCDRLDKSVLPSINGDTSIKTMTNFMLDAAGIPLLSKRCFEASFWIPYMDEITENIWLNYYTQKQETMDWKAGQPNGDRSQNCAEVDPKLPEKNIFDIECNNKYCFICENNHWPQLTLRGLCPESYIDEIYIIAYKDGIIYFSGDYNTEIQYDFVNFEWILTVAEQDTVAKVKASYSSFLLGVNQWLISNDSKLCTTDETYERVLSMSSCSVSEYRNFTE